MNEANIESIEKDRVILVGLNLGGDLNFDHHMKELEDLCEACGYEVAGAATQSLQKPHSALYIGAGKVQEVKEYAENLGADIVVFDDALSPSQVRNLNEVIGLPIMDRTAVILEIFASRARTREARLQVDLARYQYLLPRLTGMGQALSRQGGNASSSAGTRSNRGAGETKLELDRRRIEHRITELSREVEEIKKQRTVQRKSRAKSRLPQVSLVGYTNAGKSTILNQFLLKYGNRDVKDMAEKTVLQEDMLFATLDTTVRKLTPAGRPPFYLSDTVGFIEKLPHHLVDAFRSTLEEVCAADLLLQVVDVSDPHYREQMEVTRETLTELGAGDIPMITVYNKADLAPGDNSLPIVNRKKPSIRMAAGLGIGLDELLDLICEQLFGEVEQVRLLLPYREASLLDELTRESDITVTEYRADGIYVETGLPCKSFLYDACEKYILSVSHPQPPIPVHTG